MPHVCATVRYDHCIAGQCRTSLIHNLDIANRHDSYEITDRKRGTTITNVKRENGSTTTVITQQPQSTYQPMGR